MNQNKFLLINNEIKGIDWVPRAFLIFLGVSFAIASMDVFSEGYSELETVFALLIHLIPALIVFATLYLSWRRDFIGGTVLLILSLLTLWFFNPDGYIFVSFPLLICSVLYYMSWWKVYRDSDLILM